MMQNQESKQSAFTLALASIQADLRAPKNQVNSFGGYRYRKCEDILEAVKPHLKEHGLVLTVTDDLVEVGGRHYVKAEARLTNSGGYGMATTAFAREADVRKGMDVAQITGTASSYARKYALNGLLCIDDCRDADATNEHGKGDLVDPPKSTKADDVERLYTLLLKGPSGSEEVAAYLESVKAVPHGTVTIEAMAEACTDEIRKRILLNPAGFWSAVSKTNKETE